MGWNAKSPEVVARQAEQKRKLALYRDDYALFAREHIKIRLAEPGKIGSLDIVARPAQQFLHAKCEEQLKEYGFIRVRGLKARQQGWSTYSQGRAFQGSSLLTNFNTLLIANDRETTETIFRIAKFAFDRLDPVFGLRTKYDSKKELVFQHRDGDSRMTFVQAKDLAGTGTTIHYLHTSETAKWPATACDLLETSLMPALHMIKGTAHIDESTAFVRGGYFRDKCDATRRGDDYYGWVMVPWWFDPTYRLPLDKNERFVRTEEERILCAIAKKGQKQDGVPPKELTNEQLKWKRVLIANAGPEREHLWPQEYLETYDDAWVTMDEIVFPHDALQRQAANCCLPKHMARLLPSHSGNYSHEKVMLRPPSDQMMAPDKDYVAIWRLPEPSHLYAMGIDVALGMKTRNWTVFEVFDIITREQIAEAHLHIDPDDAGWLAYSLGMFYNVAQINTELTGPGYNTDSRLKKLLYPNLYIWRNRERMVPKLTNLTGWKTTPESKKFLIGLTRPLFNHDRITIHSRVLLDECLHFVVVPGFVIDQYEAESGDDDCVMAMMFALGVIHDENYMEDISPDGETKKQPTSQEVAVARQHAIHTEITDGPWAVDNRSFEGQGQISVLDNLVASLKGWE